MDLEKQKRIEQRAYLFWQAEGQPHGRHEEHWHRAARQIEAEEDSAYCREAQEGEGRRASRRKFGTEKIEEIAGGLARFL